MNPADFKVLSYLFDKDEARWNELEKQGFNKSTLSASLDRLQNDKLVLHVSRPADTSYVYKITPAGKRAYKEELEKRDAERKKEEEHLQKIREQEEERERFGSKGILEMFGDNENTKRPK
jgi:DNA-binding MarR family transcriptional regulator